MSGAWGGTTQKCSSCGRTVYPVEELTADGRVYHRPCFRCHHCKSTLQFSNYNSIEGVLYCKPHYDQILKSTGSLDKSFEGVTKSAKSEKSNGPKNKEKSISLKTMEDGQVMLYSSSVNGKEAKIPLPRLVFNEKVKVNSVFLRDSTAISDSVLLLFGGNLQQGGLDGHLKMLGGYLEFFMNHDLALTYLSLKSELESLIHSKLQNPRMDIQTSDELLSAIRLLVSEDPCSGRFVYGRQEPAKIEESKDDALIQLHEQRRWEWRGQLQGPAPDSPDTSWA